MTAITIFITALLGITIFPALLLYLMVSYMAFNGLASRELIYNELKVVVGSVNIFPIDLLYGAGAVLALVGIIRMILTGGMRRYARPTRSIIILVICYFMFYLVKMVNGYFTGVPLDSLVRMFALDTQCVYLFLPIFYLKQEKTLKHLLYFIVVISLLFPLAQPLLYGSADQVSLLKGQGGTLRLGFGNANVLLMLGALAFFVWEKKMWLTAMPLAGIAMLAQRSAFISMAFCVLVISVMKKKSIKFIAIGTITGLLLMAVLYVIQETTNVPVVGKTAERLYQTFEKTNTTKVRMDFIPFAFEAFEKRPLVGFGYGDIFTFMEIQDRDALAFNMLHPHNFVLTSLLNSGLVGSILLFLIIGTVLTSTYRLMRMKDMMECGLYLLATLLFFLIFSLMNTTFTSDGGVFWMLAGISLWYQNRKFSAPNNKTGSVQ